MMIAGKLLSKAHLEIKLLKELFLNKLITISKKHPFIGQSNFNILPICLHPMEKSWMQKDKTVEKSRPIGSNKPVNPQGKKEKEQNKQSR